jgi:acetyl esterase/lipase
MRRRPHPAILLAALALLAPAKAADAPVPLSSPLAGIEVHRDLPYGRAETGSLTLDVYRPSGAPGSAPVLLFLHGGGWILGSKQDAMPEVYPHPTSPGRRWPSVLPYLQRGVAVVSVDYRLAKDAPAPAAIEDCRHALDWIATNGATYGLDASRVVTFGPSAGGHLALMVAFTNGGRADVPPGRVVGTIDLYGITDVEALLPDPRRPWAAQWIGSEPEAAARARRVSPLSLVRPGLPPVLIMHSDADEVVPYEQSLRLVQALRDAKVPAELVTFSGAPHGFFDRFELARVEEHIVGFLTRLGLVDSTSPE